MKEQILTIPEGFEIKQTGENQYSIVEKKKSESQDTVQGSLSDVRDEQMHNAVHKHANSFFGQEPEDSRDDYDFGMRPMMNPFRGVDKELLESKDRDALFDARFGNPYRGVGDFDYSVVQKTNSLLHDMYDSGKIQKINEEEMKLLRFCSGIDVKKFIKEEFEKNPIEIKQDKHGYIYAETPNGSTKIDYEKLLDDEEKDKNPEINSIT